MQARDFQRTSVSIILKCCKHERSHMVIHNQRFYMFNTLINECVWNGLCVYIVICDFTYYVYYSNMGEFDIHESM